LEPGLELIVLRVKVACVALGNFPVYMVSCGPQSLMYPYRLEALATHVALEVAKNKYTYHIFLVEKRFYFIVTLLNWVGGADSAICYLLSVF
jgi:hypothetical protein